MRVAVMFLACVALWATGEKPNLSGTWKLNGAQSQTNGRPAAATVSIEEQENSIHITEELSGAKVEVECSVDGKECAYKEEGKPARAQFYYNGARLVELKYMGRGTDHVVKRRMTLSDDGKTVRIEIIPMNPANEPQSLLVYEKQ